MCPPCESEVVAHAYFANLSCNCSLVGCEACKHLESLHTEYGSLEGEVATEADNLVASGAFRPLAGIGLLLDGGEFQERWRDLTPPQLVVTCMEAEMRAEMETQAGVR